MPSPSPVPFECRTALRRKAAWLTGARAAVLALLLTAPVTASAQIRVTAAWEPNLDAVTAGYRVTVRTSPGGTPLAEINAGTATRVELPLPQGSVYYVTVRAYSPQGLVGPSSVEAIVDLSAAPGPPAAFWADVNGPRATLNWSPPTTGGLPSGYILSVGTAPGAANLVSGYPVGAAQSVSGDLPPGTYFARLRASNPLGAGPPSSELTFQVSGGFRPLRPTALVATWVGTNVQLSWTAPSGSPAEMPAYYIIEAGSESGDTNVGTVNVGAATNFVVDVPPGTYYVRVRGVNDRGVSDPSNELVLQGRGAPGTPRNLAMSASGNTVRLSWSAPNSGGPVASYVLEAGSGPGLSDLAVVDIGSATTFSTVVPPGVYYVRVRAVNARGSGAPSNQVTIRR